jgi:hypothetical protein
MKKILSLVGFFLLTAPLLAEETHQEHHEDSDSHEHATEESHEHHGEEHSAATNVGPDSAVLEANPERGFRLSEKAVRALGVEIKPSSGLLPKSSVVYFKDETGVYRVRDGWFKLIEGEAEPQGSQIRFTPEHKDELQKNDFIAVKGVPLLRVTELDVFSAGGGDPHGH